MKKRCFLFMYFFCLIAQLCFSQTKVLFVTADNQWAKLESHNEGMDEYMSNAFAYVFMRNGYAVYIQQPDKYTETNGDDMDYIVEVRYSIEKLKGKHYAKRQKGAIFVTARYARTGQLMCMYESPRRSRSTLMRNNTEYAREFYSKFRYAETRQQRRAE